MGKRLIICSDGTWNKPNQKDRGQVCPSNVYKISRAIRPVAADGREQLVFYDQGVGTGGGLDRWTGGAFGHGLDKNIEDNYRFIVENFVEGDEVYFFGFSRGAYTVRSTAGLIRNSGILKREFIQKIPEAMRLYRRQDVHPDSEIAKNFKDDYAYVTRIKFIGVWDTVGALGIPVGWLRWITRKKYEFHDVQLSRQVENAFHALAIDERRRTFSPTLWKIRQDGRQQVKQVWFAGVHSNIGGGYADSGLSDVTLMWMKENASRCGLEFDEDYIRQNIKPNPLGEIRDSKTGIFKLFSDYLRLLMTREDGRERIHDNALQRFEESPDYKPQNLKSYLDKRNDFI
jgi:uncharacterized protein (DUF2235 family)